MKSLIFFILILIGSKFVYGQEKEIYYLLDTASVPVNDRIVNIELKQKNERYIYIHAPCLVVENSDPVEYEPILFKSFRQHEKIFEAKCIDSIEFISLTALINRICNYGGRRFNQTYDVFFVEKRGDKFVYYKARLLYSTVIN